MAKEFTLHLDDIHHFFAAPEFDPFAAHPRDTSGVDWIIAELKTIPKPNSLQATLYIPAEQITPELTDQVHLALQNYSDTKIEQASQEIRALRKHGLRGLGLGGLFLAICGLLAIASQALLSPWLGGFLFNGFTIIGWVSLWHPSEILLFDWIEPWRSQRLYKLIETMKVEIKVA